MTDVFEDVGTFHHKFDLPFYKHAPLASKAREGDPLPHLLDPDTFLFRFRFMEEELTEIAEAHETRDLEKFLDGLIDLVYVACGTAHLAHLPFNQGWALVHQANMLKERALNAADSRSTRKHVLDVVKPSGWKPADLKPLLILP